METRDYMEFREIENAEGTDATVRVYFLGVLVHTIEHAWTRPGGEVYTEREVCVIRAQRTVQQSWDRAGSTR